MMMMMMICFVLKRSEEFSAKCYFVLEIWLSPRPFQISMPKKNKK